MTGMTGDRTVLVSASDVVGDSAAVDLTLLRHRLKVVRDPMMNPYQTFNGTSETIGGFAHRQALERYCHKTSHKRHRARELRRHEAEQRVSR
jgi:hypothetical protein